MKILESLKERRTYYDINRDLPVEEVKVFDLVEKATELVPDAFNMKSSRVIVATGEKQDQLWDNIYDVFEGKVPREKIDSFKNGYGTILYFYDEDIVKNLQNQFTIYADRFPGWANQSSGMLQLSIWSGLKELGIGASLQHYNPVIDKMVREMFDLPENYVLNAQMPFGGIGSHPDEKAKEDISNRVKIVR
ncbi:MAG: nitroreductase [Clostridiales bacterium 43-6]|nr:MAG: nitroreductase [Clostridiales bacterium 43-6]